MAEPLPDLYADLGVAPDVDARAIKAAYFALVRQFPPETHAQEFQRIRAAYEVLSDPERRAAYDEARLRPPEPEDPEADALWSAARAASEAGDLEAELRALRRLAEIRPALSRPREILAEQLLGHGRGGDAEPLLRRLVEEQPEAPRLLLLWARALHQLGRPVDALEAIDRARPLGPEEPGLCVALADALAELRLFDRARAELDRAVRLAGVERPIPPLARRQAAWLFEEKEPGRAVEWIERALDAWADAEPAARLDAVAFLAGFAAFLFSRDRWDLGNRVLARARAVAPDAAPGPFPDQVRLHADELPAQAREWVRDQRARPRWLSRYYAVRPARLFSWIAAALTVAYLVLLSSFNVRHRFDRDGWVWVAGFAALSFGAVAAALERWWRSRRDLLGRGLILHGLHLLEVELDRLRVTPLLALAGIEVRPRRGGLFQAVFTRRGRGACRLTLNTRDEADDVARQVAAQRQRAMDLLAEGALHREDSWDLFPPALLARRGLARRLGLLRPRRLAWAACALLAAGGATGLLAQRSADRRMDQIAFAVAAQSGTVEAWHRYLAACPNADQVGEARLRLSELLDRARASLVARGAGPVLLAAFDAHAAEGRALPVVVAATYDGPSAPDGGVLAPALLSDGSRLAREADRFVSRLNGRLAATARTRAALSLAPVPATWSSYPLWRLRLALTATGDELTPEARAERRALAVDARWALEVRAGATAAFEPVGEGAVAGPDALEMRATDWNGPPDRAAGLVYLQELNLLADGVADAAAAALGIDRGAAP